MRARNGTLFTPAEAAVLTQLSIKAVNNAIDKKTVSTVAGNREGRSERLLDLRGLMSLALERRLLDRLLPAARREVFTALSGGRGDTLSIANGFLKIDLKEPRQELARSIGELRRAQRLVVVHTEIMGGEPVFRGTRIPVRGIAAQLAHGESSDDLRAAYPRLTSEMIRLAPLYAAAYPPRGRRRAQPWQRQPPKYRSRRKLTPIDVA